LQTDLILLAQSSGRASSRTPGISNHGKYVQGYEEGDRETVTKMEREGGEGTNATLHTSLF
jgi:hypothetical protein